MVDNPLCICGEIETSTHYFLQCNRYSHIRNTTLSTLPHTLTAELLLYGDISLSTTQNKTIFKTAQKFIHQSKRFDTTA